MSEKAFGTNHKVNKGNINAVDDKALTRNSQGPEKKTKIPF